MGYSKRVSHRRSSYTAAVPTVLVDEMLATLLGREKHLAALIWREEARELRSQPRPSFGTPSYMTYNLLSTLLTFARNRVVGLGVVLAVSTCGFLSFTHQLEQPLIWEHLSTLGPPIPTRCTHRAARKLLRELGSRIRNRNRVALADASRLVADGHAAYPAVESRLVLVKLVERRERLRSSRLVAGWREDAQVHGLVRGGRAVVLCRWTMTVVTWGAGGRVHRRARVHVGGRGG